MSASVQETQNQPSSRYHHMGFRLPQGVPYLPVPSTTVRGVQSPEAPPTNQTAPQKGSYIGRATRWLNETSNGQMLKTAGCGLAFIGLAFVTASCAAKTAALALFTFSAFSSGAGAPVAVGALGLTLLCGAVTIGAFNAMLLSVRAAGYFIDEMNRLSAMGL